VILLIVLIFALAFILLRHWEQTKGVFSGSSSNTSTDSILEYQGEEFVENNNIETILLMGLDKFSEEVDNSSYTNNQQSDFVMLLAIDNAKKSCTAVHINRDTITDINVLGVAGQKIDTVKGQLALSYAYGDGDKVSCRNTVDSVSNIIFGAHIDHYISLTMDAVPVFNDMVGGVEVEVLDDFSNIDETLVKGEKITLLGDHALNYVRSRYNLEDSTNGRRMERQKQYLNALYNKTKLCIQNNEEFIAKSALEISEYMVSDCSVTRLQEIMEKVSSYEFTEIKTLPGESKMGAEFVEFYVDEEATKKLVVDLLFKLKE